MRIDCFSNLCIFEQEETNGSRRLRQIRRRNKYSLMIKMNWTFSRDKIQILIKLITKIKASTASLLIQFFVLEINTNKQFGTKTTYL